MNKLVKRLLTGTLAFATILTALPVTAVHASGNQYWTESAERVGYIEHVMNDGSIKSTFNEGHMKVEGETAYCVDINTNFKNGYKIRSDASTRMSSDQIADVALSLEYVKQYTALENGNPVESRIVRDRFQKLCEQNGYEQVVFHSLRHLSTGYKLKMTNGDVKSVQGDTGHAEAEMVTDVYSEIIDEDRRYNAQKMDEQFYSTLNHDSEMQPQNEEVQPESNCLSDSDMELLQLLKSLTPEMKKMLLKQSASK